MIDTQSGLDHGETSVSQTRPPPGEEGELGSGLEYDGTRILSKDDDTDISHTTRSYQPQLP